MDLHETDLASKLNSSRRIPWIDIAKSIAVFLVVLYHVSLFGVAHFLPGVDDPARSLWKFISTSLLPVRMPLFFLASGLLAAGAVNRPWHALGRSRYANILWPYLIWSVAFSAVYGFAVSPSSPWEQTGLSFLAIILGGNAYWYLTTLVLLFTIARLLRAFGPAVVLGAFCVWMMVPWVMGFLEPHIPAPLEINVTRWLTFALWFMIGCFARSTVLAIANLRQGLILPLSLATYAILALLQYVFDANRRELTLGMNIIGIIAMVSISVLLSRYTWIVALGRYLAGRTLPIYVVHGFVLYGAVAIFRAFVPAPVLPGQMLIVSAVSVPIVSIGLTFLSTWVYDITQGTWARVLFEPPALSPKRDDAVMKPNTG